MSAVPKSETMRSLDSRVTYSWLAQNHPNAALRESKRRTEEQQNLKSRPPPKGAEHIYFLLKTGQSVVWERLPVHFITTLTRMPNYIIYSDAALRMGSVEIVDSLQNITNDFLGHGELQPYQVQKFLRLTNSNLYVKEAKMLNGWLLDRFKNIWMLFDAWLRDDTFRWYVFFDDDTSLLVDGLTAWLGRLDHTKPLYLGSPVSLHGIKFGHGGSGVAVSHAAMEALFGGRSVEENKAMLLQLTRELLAEDCGDYMVAFMLKRHVQLLLAPYTDEYPFAKDKFQGEPFYRTLVTPENFCNEVVSFHHHGPQEISLIWELENHFSPEPILYRDLYQHMIHPYLAQSLAAWDNQAREFEFEAKGHYTSATKPWGSASLCRNKCVDIPKCVQYRYDPYRRYCGLSTSLSLGRAVVTYPPEKHVAFWLHQQGVKDVERQIPEEEIVSGWLQERIEDFFLKPNGEGSCQTTTEESVGKGKIDEPMGWWWSSADEM